MWAFYKTESFSEGCQLAVNLGDDGDTTGAVYGQLSGTYYGVGNQQKWETFLEERSGGCGSVAGLPALPVVVFAPC